MCWSSAERAGETATVRVALGSRRTAAPALGLGQWAGGPVAVGVVGGQNPASVGVRALAPWGGSCTSESGAHAVSTIGPPVLPGVLAWAGRRCPGHSVSPCLSWPPHFSIPPPCALGKCPPSEGSVHSQCSPTIPPVTPRPASCSSSGSLSCGGVRDPGSARARLLSWVTLTPSGTLPIVTNPLDVTGSFTFPLVPAKQARTGFCTFVPSSSLVVHFSRGFAATAPEKHV